MKMLLENSSSKSKATKIVKDKLIEKMDSAFHRQFCESVPTGTFVCSHVYFQPLTYQNLRNRTRS